MLFLITAKNPINNKVENFIVCACDETHAKIRFSMENPTHKINRISHIEGSVYRID